MNYLRERAAPPGSGGDYREQKARLTKAQAEAAEIDLAKKRGELAPVEDFEKATEAIMRTIRNNMMNIPQRAITRLLGETEEARFKDVLKDEIVQALTVAAQTEIEEE
ncbi:MAG: terminase small subunit [Ruminococcaceae bacterium]|nr:terminase small subunit [Oscillospiraceae bacterium]